MRRAAILPKPEIVAAYAGGESLSGLAARYKTDWRRIKSLLVSEGQKPRTASQASRLVNYSLNEAAFDIITPESAYWIGFLMADGCITNRTVRLVLQAGDYAHLEKYKSFLSYDGDVRFYTQREKYLSASLCVRSEALCRSLASYGVVERKSLIARVLKLENDRHFWRGLIDGDGSVAICKTWHGKYFYDRSSIKLYGSYSIVHQFKAFTQAIGILGDTPKVRSDKSIYAIDFRGKKADFLINFLYSKSAVSLDRKMKMARLILPGMVGLS